MRIRLRALLKSAATASARSRSRSHPIRRVICPTARARLFLFRFSVLNVNARRSTGSVDEARLVLPRAAGKRVKRAWQNEAGRGSLDSSIFPASVVYVLVRT